MSKEFEMVKCPTYGWHHTTEHKGTDRLIRGGPADQPKGEFVFGNFDLENTAFISIRESKGRGGGLPEIRRITLRQAKSNPRYERLTTSLLNRCYHILKTLVE